VTGPAAEGTEADLLEAARAGSGEALEALLERHEARLYRFARRLCRHREDAEDVLQESLLAAARGLPGFRGASSIGTWLYTIARSFCIKKRRRSVFAPTEVSLDTEASAAARGVPDPARRPDEELEASRLEAALERRSQGWTAPIARCSCSATSRGSPRPRSPGSPASAWPR
jgi:RNA polymerase sigma-70 factor (ECF subfamily)